MTGKQFFAAILIGFGAILASEGPEAAKAQTLPSVALTGQVSSQEEAPMEGVLVSAKKAGSTVTVTVVSDAQGRYSFPRTKLEPGRYSFRIRAVGYDLDDPGPVEVTAQKALQLDLRLRKTQDLAYQLSNAEWILSMPGTREEKEVLVAERCVECHTLERVVRSRYNAAEFLQILRRMATYGQSTPLRPQKRPARPEQPRRTEELSALAKYLSTINLSASSAWQYPLKTLPRPQGKATRVIITEYDLPRPDTQPHDAIVDSDGTVWYSDFGYQYLGRLDPRTGKVVEHAVPELRPGAFVGANNVEFDRDGNLWLGMMRQSGIAKFDKKTGKFQTWKIPDQVFELNEMVRTPMVVPRSYPVDSKVWFNNPGIHGLHRVDLRTGEIETLDPFRDLPKDSPAASRPHTCYGIAADSKNNLYCMDFGSEYIGRVDAKTQKITLYPTPTFNAMPRRGHTDAQDRLWFAEFMGNKIGMFDPKTEKVQEWALPTPWTNPYGAILDNNGEVWTGGMMTDRVARLNTETGEFIEYLLPRSTNIRRVDVDNSTTPVTFWVGNNHGASLVKLEPLDH